MKKIIQNPRGTKDILPEEQKYWRFLFENVQKSMDVFGAQRIETPIFEFAETYIRTIGKGTDIVDKEMFEVRHLASPAPETLSEEETKTMVLRPEYTAGIARAYIQNGLINLPQPVKLWYFGPAFRYERPQAGRFRIHNQFGLEVIGDNDPLTDASIILLAFQTLRKLGLAEAIKVEINSIGCSTCRTKMKKKIVEYFQDFLEDLCNDCNRRFVENPLRIFDCKEPKCQKIIDSAPQLIDLLCDPCKKHFKEVLENLDALEIPYNLNPRLVRGLDYYTRTVFEVFLEDQEEGNLAILAGGRYDNLIELLGGNSTPAVGWAGGAERILNVIKNKGIVIPEQKLTDICLIHMGDKAKKSALALIAKLSEADFNVTNILGKESLKAQLRSASKMGARICLILGQREFIDKTVIFKDMENSTQETVPQEKLIDFLQKRLK
ncbi:MAG: histidine--tRNA ligase [Patescibacteria group bacterium]|nr:histidine--tRNA ligase [Patescibacteria group bacterium]